MYYPYFRGKQYELITIRETASILHERRFVPVIEPVKEQLGGIRRALEAICEQDASAIVIVNPQLGDHRHDGEEICSLLDSQFGDAQNISRGLLLTEESSLQDIENLVAQHSPNNPLTLIHAGFPHARELASIAQRQNISNSIFFQSCAGKLYRRHFDSHHRVLIKDGFEKRRNRDHPPVEFFSDLHVTYPEDSMNGFGDFLMVGDDYSESGGPAYTVAIHITFIDDSKDGEMHIHHFKSVRQDTPKDPAGKFAEALDKLVTELNRAETKIWETPAIEEFRSLHERGHFPGLGYVKKLSMNHHIQTLALYFQREVGA